MTKYSRLMHTSGNASTPSGNSAKQTQSPPVWLLALVIGCLLLLGACATTQPVVCPPLPRVSPTALEIASRPSPLRALLEKIEAEKSTQPAQPQTQK